VTTKKPVPESDTATASWVKAFFSIILGMMLFVGGMAVNNASSKASLEHVNRISNGIAVIRVDRREKWLSYERNQGATRECLAEIKVKLAQLVENMRELKTMIRANPGEKVK